ncbi:MAG: elongation factor Ts [Candidatus Omnitrophota bacterium]|nr:MAG: elongation factor Ts [Candidatus Omnitrophota bacterium]
MSLTQIKKLRELTSLGIKDCKKALEKAKGDFDKALKLLKEKGAQVMEKKKARQTSQGLVDAYIHFGGNLGAIVEINCETDFVARTDVFKQFVKDVAMQVAAASPDYIAKDDISKEDLKKIDNIDEYAKDKCLLEQVFIKDNKITMGQYLHDAVSKTGENIVIKRFARFVLGEENES